MEEEKQEQKDQSTWYEEGSCGPKSTPTLQELACRQHIHMDHMQRLSKCVGSSAGTVASTTSLVWWYQPDGWAPNYWASLVFYCSHCQQGHC